MPPFGDLPIGIEGGHLAVHLPFFPVLGTAENAVGVVIVPSAVLVLARIAALGHQLAVRVIVFGMRRVASCIVIDAALHLAGGAVVDEVAHGLVIFELPRIAQLAAFRPIPLPRSLFAALGVLLVDGGAGLCHANSG